MLLYIMLLSWRIKLAVTVVLYMQHVRLNAFLSLFSLPETSCILSVLASFYIYKEQLHCFNSSHVFLCFYIHLPYLRTLEVTLSLFGEIMQNHFIIWRFLMTFMEHILPCKLACTLWGDHYSDYHVKLRTTQKWKIEFHFN